MKYGWIHTNIADMWLKPEYNSERVNQIFFSDGVKILKEKKGFFFVEKHDNYQGWVDKRFISRCTFKSYTQNFKQRNYVVKADHISVLPKNSSQMNPHVLFYGTTLSITHLKDNKSKIKLPDNSILSISSSSLTRVQKRTEYTKAQIIIEAKRFLGVPYLWGGITSTGFDCSGFTQTILSRFSVSIPRDTKDQIKIGENISRKNLQTGDLLFFDRHVGFAIGKNKIIHSSIGGSGVKIHSLSSNDQHYRKDLDESFKTARRIL